MTYQSAILLTSICLLRGYCAVGAERGLPPARVQGSEALAVGVAGPLRLPITYIQSGFTTNDPPAWFYRDLKSKTLRAEGIHLFFDGAEILNLNVDSVDGRRDVRRLASAMAAAENESKRPFYGFWSFPRLPGYFRPDDIARQPVTFRATSLKSDGSVWVRLPSLPEENESKIKFSGESLDITNANAVSRLLANVARVFRWDGPDDDCIGPIHGFIVLNEWLLSSNYESVWSPHEKEHDVPAKDTIMRLGRKPHLQLFSDEDPHYGYFNPPKRAMPLYSESARRSFQVFARGRGLTLSQLPADRDEFNDDDTTVSLPPWVRFVDRSETTYWGAWEDWAYHTWFTFLERLSREWSLAQEGNSRFKGVIYFQLPMWYSIRDASRRPVTFPFHDRRGDLRTETVVMRDHPEYDRLNPVVMGTDMELFMRSPWFAGVIHETTKSIPIRIPGNLPLPEHDRKVHNHPRFKTYFMAQGALLKKVCRERGKLFGAFARSQHFRGHDHLQPDGFEHAFRGTILPLQPDIIATIGPWFAENANLPTRYQDVLRGSKGHLEEPWRRLIEAYRRLYEPWYDSHLRAAPPGSN